MKKVTSSQAVRVDRNANGGGIMLLVREDIPSKLLSVNNGFFR